MGGSPVLCLPLGLGPVDDRDLGGQRGERRQRACILGSGSGKEVGALGRPPSGVPNTPGRAAAPRFLPGTTHLCL